MFTGIVQDIGVIRRVKRQGDWRIEIKTALDMAASKIGDSMACAGICLTVTDKGQSSFTVSVSEETLSKTSVKNWEEGTRINLEPAMRLGDPLGGHFVSGHVDAQVVIEDIDISSDSRVLTLRSPAALMEFIAPKGSVTLDGVSLTVNNVENDCFTVNIIPHTLEKTTLGDMSAGDAVNLEIDILARYIANMMERRAA